MVVFLELVSEWNLVWKERAEGYGKKFYLRSVGKQDHSQTSKPFIVSSIMYWRS